MSEQIALNVEGDRAYLLDLKREALDARMTLKAYVRQMIDRGRKGAEKMSVVPPKAPPAVLHGRPPQFSRGQKSPFTPVPPPADEDVHYESDENA